MTTTKLVVVVVRAEILNSTKKITKMSTYAIARIGKRQFETNICKYGGLTPHWDERFATFFNESERDLCIELWEQDYGNHILIADGVLELKDCKDAGSQTLWVKLNSGNKYKGKILVYIKCGGEEEPIEKGNDPFESYVEKKIFKRRQTENAILNPEMIQKALESKSSKEENAQSKKLHTQTKSDQVEPKIQPSNQTSKSVRTDPKGGIDSAYIFFPLNSIADHKISIKKQFLESITSEKEENINKSDHLSIGERQSHFYARPSSISRTQSLPLTERITSLDSDRSEKQNKGEGTTFKSSSIQYPKFLSRGQASINQVKYDSEKMDRGQSLNDLTKKKDLAKIASLPKLDGREVDSRESNTNRTLTGIRKSEGFVRSDSAPRFDRSDVSENYNARALHGEDQKPTTNHRPLSQAEFYQRPSNLMVIKAFKNGIEELRKQRPLNPLHNLGMFLIQQSTLANTAPC